MSNRTKTTSTTAEPLIIRCNPYARTIKGVTFDAYDLAVAYGITHPAVFHAFKKILADGTGDKDRDQNLREALWSLQRYFEMQEDS